MALQEEFQEQGNWLFKRRGFLPLYVMVVGITVFIFDIITTPFIELTTIFGLDGIVFNLYTYLALLVSLFGLFIRIFTIGYASDNTSGRNTHHGQVAESVNKTGIYSIIRHPLYVGNFFMWLGITLLTLNFWFIVAFILWYIIYYERIMYAEEQFLRGKFKEEYTDWASSTPAVIPAFRKYIPALRKKFNTNKVLCNEILGLLLVFLLFVSFNVIRVTLCYFYFKIDVVSNLPIDYPLLVSTCVVLIFYLTTRFLKKRTSLLKY